MIRSIRMMLLPALFTVAMAAVPAEAAPRSISVVLIGADGVPGEPVDASDLQISLSRSADAGSTDGNNMASISLDVSALVEPKLMEWISKGGDTDAALITVEGRNGGSVYLLTGVVSRNVSISHTTSNMDGNLSLSLGSKHLAVNGHTVN